MYSLTLTRDDREAFDWVGGRYATGDDVADILKACLPDDDERWYESTEDITIAIPQHRAWEIFELAESEDGSWSCFSDDLRAKMVRLCDSVV